MTKYGPDLFAGTAEYYAKFRPKYPPQLFNDIVQYFHLDGRGRLLDLGCGTGELAIPLANFCREIIAQDPDPAMSAVGRRKSIQAGCTNIQWQIGSAETLSRLEGLFTVVGIGQALHWMDTRKVIDDSYDLLFPGGGLFVVGSWDNTQPTAQNGATTRKNAVIDELIAKYLGPRRRAGQKLYQPTNLSWEDDLFPNSKFRAFEKRHYGITAVRNVEQELGNLHSMSWARTAYFGGQIHNFEAEFKRKLKPLMPKDGFVNRVEFHAYFLKKDS